MSNYTKQVIISSLYKNINRAKIYGVLDNSIIYLYDILQEYEELVKNNSIFYTAALPIRNLIIDLKYNFSNIICNTKIILPTKIENNIPTTPTIPIITPNPVLTAFTVTTTKREIIPNSGELIDSYEFKLSDILSNYKDSDDNQFLQLSIDRNDLFNGYIKIKTGSGINDYTIYDEATTSISVSKSLIESITFYSESTSIFTHLILIRVLDKGSDGVIRISNTVSITIDRTAVSNQPAVIGDIAIDSGNRVTTVLTLTMFTSSLTPPYNDPEGDLIDAIRIDEISTANSGKFYLNGIEIVTNQIITREDLIAGLFTHEGADVNTIETDAINFSARDEGSLIWVQ
tara:strand:- start:68492 stop:69523 length:1032 start_codon:yes stop_codon:yes gene_type:complete